MRGLSPTDRHVRASSPMRTTQILNSRVRTAGPSPNQKTASSGGWGRGTSRCGMTNLHHHIRADPPPSHVTHTQTLLHSNRGKQGRGERATRRMEHDGTCRPLPTHLTTRPHCLRGCSRRTGSCARRVPPWTSSRSRRRSACCCSGHRRHRPGPGPPLSIDDRPALSRPRAVQPCESVSICRICSIRQSAISKQ